jgi:hypothetical protein
VLNRTSKLLIGKDISRDTEVVDGAVITTTAGSTGLADGEIVVLDKYFKVMATGATIADTEIIYICQGTGDTFSYVTETPSTVSTVRRLLFSEPIQGDLVRSYKGVSYSAAVEQVTTITPETPVTDTEYFVRIIYTDMPHPSGNFTQTYRYKAISTNVHTGLLDGLVAKINAHAGARVVATEDASTLILTAKPIDTCTNSLTDYMPYQMVTFKAVFNKISVATGHEGEWVHSGDVVYTTKAFAGSGTWEQMRDLERDLWANRGAQNFMPYPYQSAPTQRVVKDATYDIITIEHDKSYLSPDNQYVKRTPLTTILAFVVPTTGTQESIVLGKLNTWMASLPGAFANVTV